jgi:hypothetical protein
MRTLFAKAYGEFPATVIPAVGTGAFQANQRRVLSSDDATLSSGLVRRSKQPQQGWNN